jgi:hypothetical protein
MAREPRHKQAPGAASEAGLRCHKVCSAAVEPQRPTFSLAGAGSVLIGFTTACIVVGALIGWLAGNLGYGLAFGAVVGIPVGVAATVIRYRNL